MKLVSLFTGIGGFDLGFERAGFETILQCEVDKNCQKLLAEKFPHAKRSVDVRTVGDTHAAELRAATVLCGGFPCQDLSVAGQRSGLAGERSGLWFAFRTVIDQVRPPWVVIENVPGLLSINNGADLFIIISGLAQLGYRWAYRVLDSQYFGLSQRRKRVFIVASLGNYGCAEVLFERESLCWNTAPSRETGQRVAPTVERSSCFGGGNTSGDIEIATACNTHDRIDFDTETFAVHTAKPLGSHHPRTDLDNETYVAFSSKDHGADAGKLSPTLRSMNFKDSHINGGGQVAIAFTERSRKDGRNFEAQEDVAYALTKPGSGGRTHSRQIATQSSVRRLTPTECERLQGFEDGWTAGFPDSTRYRMLGNAVSVPVAEWIAKRLKNQLTQPLRKE